MVLVGLLMTRNEGDVIQEVLADHFRQFDAIFAMDGSDPGEGTWEALEAAAGNPKLLYRESFRGPSSEHLRGQLFNRAAEWIGRYHRGQAWVFPIQGDELYYHNLRRFVDMAERQGAGVLNCWVADFALHPSERESVWAEDPAESIRRRRRWCFINHQEHCGFRYAGNLWWPREYPCWVTRPEGLDGRRWASVAPLRLHYPFRHPVQAWRRIIERHTYWTPRWEWAIQAGSVFCDKWPEDGTPIVPFDDPSLARFKIPWPARELNR